MSGRLEPFEITGKTRLRGTDLLSSSPLILVHVDEDRRHRLGVLAEHRDLAIRHRFRFLAQQLPTTRDGDGHAVYACGAGAVRACGTGFNPITQPGHHIRARVWLPGGAVKAVSPEGGGAKRRALTAPKRARQSPA